MMSISELAKEVDVTVRTIRYYTKRGLLPFGKPHGTTRQYGREHETRLRLIKLLKAEDMPLDKIKARLKSLSLREMEELVSLGSEMRESTSSGRPMHPAQLLAATLTKPADTDPNGGKSSPSLPATDEPRLLKNEVDQLLFSKGSLPVHSPLMEQGITSSGPWQKVLLSPGVELMFETGLSEEEQDAINDIIEFGIETLRKASAEPDEP
jgi:DNA-binding transcriptional MerR regulator